MRLGSCAAVAVTWATEPIQPLARELPCATGVVLKKKKKKRMDKSIPLEKPHSANGRHVGFKSMTSRWV